MAVVSKVFAPHKLGEISIFFICQAKLCGRGNRVVRIAVAHAIVCELVGGNQIGNKCRHAVFLYFNVRRDAAAVAHDAPGRRAELLGQRVGQMHGFAVLELVGLHAAPRRQVIACRGKFHRRVIRQFERLLHEALAVGALPHDDGAVVVLQRAARNFGGRGRTEVSQYDQGRGGIERVVSGFVFVIALLGLSFPAHYLLAARQEEVDRFHCLIDHAARIAAKVEYKGFRPLLFQVHDGAAHFFRRAVNISAQV